MHFQNLDLNLLVALDALLEERSVSRAAERLYLTQSATSSALSRLREYFNDDLLVSVGRRMEPTALALTMAPQVRNILQQIRVTIGGTSASPTSNPSTIQNVPLGRQNYQITGQVVCSLFGGLACMPQARGMITVDKNDTYGLQWVFAPGQPCRVTLVKQ